MNYQNNWTGIHIFLTDHVKLENFMHDVVVPAANRCMQQDQIDSWFFLRYWEGGPHMRFRVRNITESALEHVVDEFRSKTPDYLSGLPLQRESFYQGNKFDGEDVDIDSLPWFEEGSVEVIDYQPEFVRYGGEKAIDAAETTFYHSSELVRKILCDLRIPLQKRTQIAWDLMLITALKLRETDTKLSDYFKLYAKYWGTFHDKPEQLQQALGQNFEAKKSYFLARFDAILSGNYGKQLGEAYTDWAAHLDDAKQTIKHKAKQGLLKTPYVNTDVKDDSQLSWTLDSINSSQMHMTNNRLGMVPQNETKLASLIGMTAAEAGL